MPITPFAVGDKFIYRVLKSLTTNPDNRWVNTYEFRAGEVGAEADLLTLGTALVNFEIAMSRETVQFERLTISTWVPDSVPYDPAAFITTTLTGAGTLPITDDVSPLNMCLSVARIAATGRSGHIFLRGNLTEEDVTAPAGKSVLTARPTKQTQLDGALSSSGLDAYIGPEDPIALFMVMVNKDGTQIREVKELLVQGVTTLPQDHAWFNRRPPA